VVFLDDFLIQQLVHDLSVDVVYNSNLDAGAHYFSAMNTIVVNSSLPIFDQKKNLLHELGHVAKHKDEVELYNTAFSLHSKMEYEANQFMINSLISEYDGHFNYSVVLETFNLGLGWKF